MKVYLRVGAVRTVLAVLWQVLLVAKLSKSTNMTYLTALSPLLIAEGVAVAYHVWRCKQPIDQGLSTDIEGGDFDGTDVQRRGATLTR